MNFVLFLFIISTCLASSQLEVKILPNGNVLHHLQFKWKHYQQGILNYPDGDDLPATYYLNKHYNVSISEVVMTRGNWKTQYGKAPYALSSGSFIALQAPSDLNTKEYYLALSTLLQNVAYQGLSVQPTNVHNLIHKMNVTHYISAPSDWSCLENVIRIKSLIPKMDHSELLNSEILKSELYSFKVRQSPDEFIADILLVRKSFDHTHNIFDVYKTHCTGTVLVDGFVGLTVNGKPITTPQTFDCKKNLTLSWNDSNQDSVSSINSRYYYVSKPSPDSISDGTLRYELVNKEKTSLTASLVISIPNFLNPKKLKCFINDKTVPCHSVLPHKATQKSSAVSIPIKIQIPSLSTLNIEVDVSYVFQHRSLHSQEPQRGWDVPSVECILSTQEIIISNNLLVGLPAPDFSMPYNVLALSLAIFALGIGNSIDIVIQKRNYLLENQVKSNLPTILLVLRSIYYTLKNKKKESHQEEQEINENSQPKDTNEKQIKTD
ncbi:hypothetical protein EHI8A_098090 [Entamoeba histolytica HM-1:IMSS-B]|uniref:GPI transamidase component PIG-T n=3 Tax=Entamoeba histolytica TaxID=5759 RepID=M3TAA9_ENTH1|nr:hypothetical protein EHI8A_098090 [Entamoeba histolytica HM-1:IMSS-B]EMS13886.1 hypothetical protein KM1_081210 [Entamoeba histolytica HM-3:IMSS]ENY62677.1 hypothetical protein EHI7A_093940 [Entamoeba histolytica HM-1:IMSS-A]